jgi:hypothetical protein
MWFYRQILTEAYAKLPLVTQSVQKELREKNLACWCPLDQH